jgi:hypothetical protein
MEYHNNVVRNKKRSEPKMTSIELKERVIKAEEKVLKCKNTIKRHNEQAEKKLAAIRKNGWDENNRYCKQGTEEHYDACWAICGYESKIEDIKSATEKLKEAETILENWKAKYNKQTEMESIINNEMPPIFIECRNELAEEWTKTDIKRRAVMQQKKKELDYKEFRKMYKYTEEESLNKTDEEFYKINLREAELFIIDFYNRIINITGTVTDWGNIYYSGKALNGWAKGEKGMTKVETILAGGYNIQRLHMRVLVKEIK